MIENYNPIAKKNNVLAPFWDNAFIHKNASTGAVASFQDGVGDVPIREMSAEINPVQNLNGYDYPWPAGGGKNLLDYSTASTSASFVDFSNILFENGKTYTFTYYGASNVSVIAYKHGTSTRIFASGYVKTYTYTASETESADVRFYNSDGITAQENMFQMEIGSTSTSFAPFSNICPISGYTGAEVSVTGINIWNEVWELGGINNQNGSEYVASDRIRSKFIPCKPNSQYYFNSPSAFGAIAFYDTDKQCLSVLANANSNIVRTSPNNACYIRFQLSASYGATYNHDVSINYPATDKEYHAYTGNIYSISFPSSAGTVYSGYVTINKDGSGTLVVDKANVDLGTLTWNRTTSYSAPVIYANVAGKKASEISLLCSVYKFSGNFGSATGFANSSENESIGNCRSNEQIFVRDDSYTDAAAFKSAMSGVQLVYELASPVTYTIPANQIDCITFLSGLNNVWINTGDITNLVYYSDAQTLNEETEMLKKYVSANTITDTASGAIASFTDGAADIPLKSLEVGINPVQDLHGYDNPWPEGGGKNILPYPFYQTTLTDDGITFTDNGDGSVTLNGTSTGTATFILWNHANIASGETVSVASFRSGTGSAGIYDRVSKIRDTGSGSTETFPDGYTGDIRIELGAGITCTNYVLRPMIVYGSTMPTSYEPYSNICPISGHTECNVTRTGKNLANQLIVLGDTSGLATWDDSLQAIKFANAIGATKTKYNTVCEINKPCQIRLSYDLRHDGNDTGDREVVRIYYSDGTSDQSVHGTSAVGTWRHVSFSSNPNKIVQDVRYGVFYGATGFPSYIKNLQVEISPVETDYEPFQGEVYPITFPSGTGTVYGGTLDATNRVLTIDRKSVEIQTLDWYYDNSNALFTVDIPDIKSYSYTSNITKTICSSYKYKGSSKGWASMVFGEFGIANKNFRIKDTRYNTASAFKTALTGETILYELATPITIPLSASQITTLLGINNVLADCNGDVSLEYVANAKLYIAKKISEALS